jgi:hypothetical protein
MTLYVDLDGVLANFDAGYFALTGRMPNREADNVEWKLMTAGFYRNLELLPDALELWSGVEKHKPTILTGIPKSIPTAEAEKRAWVAHHFGSEVPVITCFSREKSRYANPGDILIDDWEKYQSLWLAAGGIWITHYSAAQTLRELEEILQ